MLLGWLQLVIAQTQPDPGQLIGELLVKGGSGIGYVFGLYMVLDRFGLLKRKSSNGSHGSERIVILLEQIAHNVERLADRSDLNTDKILTAIANKEG